MDKFIRVVVIFSLINFAWSQVITDLVKVRNIDEIEGAEFYAFDTAGLIERWGYPVEIHNIETEDGYRIKIFRIPWSKKSPERSEKKPVVILQPILGGSSDNWVVFGPNRSLAIQLADEGYDVWMGNYRGNTYGRSHISLSPRRRKFWNFSYHEIGTIDQPNTIDYILNTTGHSSLVYIGHSMGTTSIFVLLSEKPEYNKKIQLLITFTPVAVWKANTLLRLIIVIWNNLLQTFIEESGSIECVPQSSTIAGLFKRICIPRGIEDWCLLPMNILTGKGCAHFEKDELVELLTYLPAGSSLKNYYHYSQAIESGKFAQYDYGSEINRKRYGQANPPEYNLKNIAAPLLIFYGENDPLSMKEDVEELQNRISSEAIFEAVDSECFAHLDFFLAKDVKRLVNDRVIDLLSQFKNHKIFNFQ